MRRSFAAALAIVMVASCSATEEVPVRRAKAASRPGGSMTISIGSPAAIDPAHAFERWGRFVDSLICDTLITLDPLTGEPKPAIAESWIVGDGGTQITVKLRKGVKFHDGSTLSAEDVVHTLTRVASEEEASSLAAVLRPVTGWAQVHGDEEARNEEELATLAGVRAIGSNAISITLSEARADFFRVLAHPLSAPVPRRIVARDPIGFGARPVCTGPYRLEGQWQPGDRTIRLSRFGDYYGRNTAYTRGGAGYAQRIELRVVDEGLPVRAPGDVSIVPPGDTHRARRLVAGPLPYLEYLALPVQRAPFDQRAVRVALSRALDRSIIAREVYGGVRSIARGFLPPAMGPHARDAACRDAAPARADIAGARSLLAGARVDLRGRDLPVFYNPDYANKALAESVARMWTDAFGARARATPMPWTRYVQQATGREGFSGPFRMGWEPAYIGPDAMIAPLFSSAGIGGNNVTRFDDPRFERALARDARSAGSDEDLQAHYERLEDILCEQMPGIPVVFGGARYSIDPARIDSAVDGFVDRTTGAPLARELFVRAP